MVIAVPETNPADVLENQKTLSYDQLRKWMGYLGGLLPIIMYFGANISQKTGIVLFKCDGLLKFGHITNTIAGTQCENLTYGKALSSISVYYHSIVGDIFVGILFSIGLFLITYKGYEKQDDEWVSDNIVCNIAGFAAIFVALYPTRLASQTSLDLVGAIHVGAAAIFFLLMAIISGFKFTRSRYDVTKLESDVPVPEKLFRNQIYRGCAWAIVISIAGIGLVWLSRVYFNDLYVLLEPFQPVFWLESVGLMAFGYSWLVKGGRFHRPQLT